MSGKKSSCRDQYCQHGTPNGSCDPQNPYAWAFPKHLSTWGAVHKEMSPSLGHDLSPSRAVICDSGCLVILAPRPEGGQKQFLSAKTSFGTVYRGPPENQNSPDPPPPAHSHQPGHSATHLLSPTALPPTDAKQPAGIRGSPARP